MYFGLIELIWIFFLEYFRVVVFVNFIIVCLVDMYVVFMGVFMDLRIEVMLIIELDFCCVICFSWYLSL